MAFASGRTSAIAADFRKARELDRACMVPPGKPGANTPWMPYDCAEFAMLLTEAVAEAGEHTFLDIGCGPGSKMLIARTLFGLRVCGIEADPALVTCALSQGLEVECTDALAWDGYGKYGVLWFNRPYRDRGLQRELEAKVWDQTAPGAVVICANLEAQPPSGWWIVLDDWEIRRGVWKKPGA